jgi:hypothetical protein
VSACDDQSKANQCTSNTLAKTLCFLRLSLFKAGLCGIRNEIWGRNGLAELQAISVCYAAHFHVDIPGVIFFTTSQRY